MTIIMTNKKPQRFNILRSEYVGTSNGIAQWRDKAIRKNLSERQVRAFMRKLAGRYQDSKFTYLAEPVRTHNTLPGGLLEVLNP
jgi:hypothetical protein